MIIVLTIKQVINSNLSSPAVCCQPSWTIIGSKLRAFYEGK